MNMNLAPKEEGGDWLDVYTRLPATIEDAVEYVESKFPWVAGSVQSYEEFEGMDGNIVRATHVTFALTIETIGPESVKDLVNGWLISMMNAIINSKRERLYWRQKPQILVELGQLVIRSRSSMV